LVVEAVEHLAVLVLLVALVVAEVVIQEHHQAVQGLRVKETPVEAQVEHHVLQQVVAVEQVK
jgi:hypothetical protein